MDRLEHLLGSIHDPRRCAELLLRAAPEDAVAVARQVAAVLSSLPAVHRELGAAAASQPAIGELVRRLGLLELLVLKTAGDGTEEAFHGTAARGTLDRRPARAGRLRGLGRRFSFRQGLQESFERVASLVLLALLCTTIAGLG
jgi:hypothetical protein